MAKRYSKWRDGDIDWSKRNCDIAREHGVSAASISIFRKRYGEPKEYVSRWRKADWSKRTTDLAREFKVTLASASQARRRYAPETLRPRQESTDQTTQKRTVAHHARRVDHE